MVVRRVSRRLHPGRLLGSTFARGVAMLAGGTVLAQVVTFVVAPVLTRLYDPHDFGVLAVFTSVAAIWGVVSSLRYEYAVPLPEESAVAADLLAVGGFVLVVECALGLPVVMVVGPTIFRALNVPQLGAYAWLLPVAVLFSGVYILLYFWAIRQRAYRRIATTKVNQGIWRAALQCGLGLLGIAPMGLLVGQVAGSAAGGLTLWRLARLTDRGAFSQVSWSSAKGAARRYVRFATYGSVSGLLNSLGLQLTPLVFAYMFGAATAGLFGLTQRVVTLPLSLVGVAIGEAYLSTAPALLRERPAELRRLFFRLTKRLLAFGLVPTLIIMIAGPWLFSFVFGERWYAAGQYARFLAPAMLLGFTVSPLSQTANIFERQDLQALTDLARVVLLVAVFVAASLLGWSPLFTVAGVATALCVSYALNFALSWWLLRTRLRGAEETQVG